MSSATCCVPGCLGSSRKSVRSPNQILHKFPHPQKDQERFKTWVLAVNGDIVGMDDNKIFKARRICDSHFESKYFTRNKRLSVDAVPTLYLKERASLLEEPKNLEECSISPYEERSSPHMDENETIINEEENKENHTTHKEHICDICKGTVQGFRYKCVQCVNFDLCTKCEANSEHPQHFMLRIPRPMPHDTLQRVLEVLQPLQNYFVPMKEDPEECEETLLEESVVESPKCPEREIEHPVECTKMPLATSTRDPLQLSPIQPIKPVVIQLSIDDKNPRKKTLKTQAPKQDAKRLCTNENLNVKRTKEKSVNKEICYSNAREFIENFSHRIELESNRRRRISEDGSDTDKRNLDDSEMYTNEEYIDEDLLDGDLEELL